MTLVVGITGGIGAGKSTLTERLIKKGYFVYDSDYEVGELYKAPKHEFVEFLKKIGLNNSIEKNKINKKTIAEIIFSHEKTKNKLEEYIHKNLKKKREMFIKNHKKLKTKIIFLDVPLLFEKKLENKFQKIISVISTKETRYKRIQKNKNFSKIIFNRILKKQTNDKTRRKKSDFIIINNSSKNKYIKKIDKILERLGR